MATFQEFSDSLTALKAGIVDVKAGLDAIAALVTSLKAGSVLTQAQLDGLAAEVAAARVAVDAVKAQEVAILA